jgi:hypothetical protein
VKLSHALWAEQRLRVFENRMLRRSFGPKREEVTTGCRKTNNVERHAMYSSATMIK